MTSCRIPTRCISVRRLAPRPGVLSPCTVLLDTMGIGKTLRVGDSACTRRCSNSGWPSAATLFFFQHSMCVDGSVEEQPADYRVVAGGQGRHAQHHMALEGPDQ